MKRRHFIKTSSVWTAGTLLLSPSLRPLTAAAGVSRVVQAQNKKMLLPGRPVDSVQVLKTLDAAMQAFFDRDTALEAWRMVARPGEVIGLKVNCLSGRGSTHHELVEAVSERLQQAGIKANDIIIWDRLNRDLEEGRFRINYSGKGLRAFGNDAVGFENDLQIYGSAASLVSKTVTRLTDGIINLPLLKDHSIAGITMSLKNIFGAIHNPNKYHLNGGDPYIADVNMLPAFRNKIRLTICDAIEAQHEGGPSFMPQWRWPLNSLFVARDRVALDYTGWQIIEQKRKEQGLPSLKEAGREPGYIATAARRGLGINHPSQIQLFRI